MRTAVVFTVAASFAAISYAQVLTLADIKTKGAVELSGQELQQLMPSAKVVSRTNAGSTRNWENKSDGTFVASSDNAGGQSGRSRPSSGNGTWQVTDDGTYCVSIDWNRTQEKWCRHVFKAGDKYCGVAKLEDSAAASEFEFSK